jgi:hypothetical protein
MASKRGEQIEREWRAYVARVGERYARTGQGEQLDAGQESPKLEGLRRLTRLSEELGLYDDESIAR